MLKLVSEGIFMERMASPDSCAGKASDGEGEQELAVRLLTANRGRRAGPKSKKNQISIEQLIHDNVVKELSAIEVDPDSLENCKRKERLDQKELINCQILYSVDLANRIKEQAVQRSVASTKYRYE